MFWNTLDSYGESQGAFLDEGSTPQPTQSHYNRHSIGGDNFAKQEATTKDTNGVINSNKNT